MRRYIILSILALAICTSVAAAEKPAMNVGIYPGGEPTMEVNLSQNDLLPALQALAPMIKIGGMSDLLTPEVVSSLLSGVKRVQYLQITIPASATDAQVADFYGKNLPSGDWTRVFWQKAPIGTMALYTGGDGDRLYAFLVRQATVDGKPAKQAQLAQIEGKVDYAKLLTIAGKILMK